MPTEKELEKVKQLLDAAEANIRQAKSVLFDNQLSAKTKISAGDGKVIEGVFNGESMVDSEKKHYPVPANYASKSKLVSGDVLKLTVLDDGSFVYKQIGPIKRKKIVGVLEETSDGKYIVVTEDAEFQVLPASVTYFKANHGDKLTILVPENTVSEWAAVENLLESKN